MNIDTFIKKVQNKILEFKNDCSSEEEYYNELKEAKNRLKDATANASDFQKKMFNIIFQMFDFEINKLNCEEKTEVAL